MTGTTRGQLPARVYWVRRMMVLGIALLLVVGIAKLLGGSSDGSAGDQARRVANTDPSTSGGLTSQGPDVTRRHRHKKKIGAPVTHVAMPPGPCEASDVAITPSVPKPIAGSDIKLVLDLASLNTPAC